MTAFNPNKKRFLWLPMLFFQVLGISQNKNENMDYTTGVFVGSTNRTITDKKNDLSFPVLVQYPTLENPRPTRFGPYTMDVAIDAEVMEGEFPLVLISHGNGGSHLLYRTISTYLAKKGFVVAMIEHYGNNRHNNELEKSELNLQYRPAHISLTIDGLVSDKVIGEYISTNKIGMIGHSFGGYAALAASGGTPWTKEGQKIKVQHDDRIKATILMAPAAAYFIPPNALEKVTIPILLVIGEKDMITPKQWTEDVILNRVTNPSKVQVMKIENAGHFSFISPFPPGMVNPGFLPSTDPAGFNREKFHEQLPIDIFNFLNGKL